MQTLSTFTDAGWDFMYESANGSDDIWGIFSIINDGYPFLSYQFDFTVPTVSTTSATAITQNSATSGGDITDEGGSEVLSRGVCWSTSANPNLNDSHTTDGTGAGAFTSSITGLSITTEYHIRAYATNLGGTGYGDDLTFTTSALIPTVTTTTATSISYDCATSGGEVTDDGFADITARGVCWSTSADPDLNDSHTNDGIGIGIFTSSLTGLDPITEYHYRAYATNSAGTSYGTDLTFTTLAPITPIVTTTIATSITNNSATSGGNVTHSGSTDVTARGICWSTSADPTTSNSHTIDGTGAGIFTSQITGLTPTTEYHYRAYATNSSGTSYGSDLTFTTTLIGSGTSGDPHQIASLTDLRWLSEHSSYWNLYFIQTTDIDAGDTQNWNSGTGFNPIGSGSPSFTGNYDGQDHTISGLFINRPGSYYQGLFGRTSGATITALGVSNVYVNGGNHIGGLVGYNYYSTVSQCYSTGSINGSSPGSSNIGGLVGYNYNSSTISQCYSSGSVNGYINVGGLAGNNYGNSTITNCYSIGSVSGSSYIGGLVGNNNGSSTISNCYSTGSVSGGSSAGGLIGKNSDGSTVSYCYSTGSVSGSNFVGGLIGYQYAYVSYSFWDTETSGTTLGVGSGYSSGVFGRTTVQMQTLSTFTNYGWDFVGETVNGTEDIWGILDLVNGGYPFLSYQFDFTFPIVSTIAATSITHEGAISGGNIAHEGESAVIARGVCWSTSINPDLNNPHTDDGAGTGVFTSAISGLSLGTEYHYRAYATNSEGTGYGDDLTFTTDNIIPPIGSGTAGDPYQIATAEDLNWISEHSASWNSHFIQTANIDATDTQNWNSGEGFIPIGNNSVFFTGTYNGQDHIIDGLYINRSGIDFQSLFGVIYDATISNLGVTNVYVSGSVCVGGLVGYNYANSTISNCFSSGSVYGNTYVGGLSGCNEAGSTISNSYSTAGVTGVYMVGGLVGSSYNSTITNSYSTGSVSGNYYFGGLVGSNSTSTVNNSFWDTQTSGQSTSAGGTGKTTAEMQMESTFTDAGWDFIYETANGTDEYWAMFSGLNNDYPVLTWQDGVLFAYLAATYSEVFVGDEIQFTDESYGDPTQWQWDFEDDGIYDSTEQNPVHIYSDDGVYSIKLSISDGANTSSYTRINYITVSSEIAGFSATPVEQFIGTTVQFTDQSYGNHTQWQWDFENDGVYDSTVQNPVHIYNDAGYYTVKLTVTNDYCTDSLIRTDYILVNSEPAPPQNVQVNLTGDDAVISWDAVTEDVNGYPLTPDLYVVQYSEVAENGDFYYLSYVLHPIIDFTHIGVLLYGNNGEPSNHMFYRVMAIKNYSTRELKYLQELNNSRVKIKWSEVKRNLERME